MHYTVWRTDTQLGSRGGLIRRYEMRLRLSQLNYADLRRSPATWALHYCPVFVSAGACRPELPLFVWREGTPLLRELLLCRQHRFHLHQLCVFHPDTCFTALKSPWAVTVQRANLTLVFPGKEKVTVRSVPLAALDFLEI